MEKEIATHEPDDLAANGKAAAIEDAGPGIALDPDAGIDDGKAEQGAGAGEPLARAGVGADIEPDLPGFGELDGVPQKGGEDAAQRPWIAREARRHVIGDEPAKVQAFIPGDQVRGGDDLLDEIEKGEGGIIG